MAQRRGLNLSSSLGDLVFLPDHDDLNLRLSAQRIRLTQALVWAYSRAVASAGVAGARTPAPEVSAPSPRLVPQKRL